MWDLGYLGAIQDLLGDNVGTLTAGGTAGAPTLSLSNAPDGSGGSVEPSAADVAAAAAAQAKVQGHADQPAVTISLSPGAQHALSQDQIALSVLLGKQAAAVQTISVPAAVPQPQASSDQPPSAQSGPSVAAQISSIIAQKKAELDGPNGIYQIADAQEVADFVTWGLSDQAKASFAKAYANHTLHVQDATTLPSLGFVDETQLTGTSDSGSYVFNQQAWAQLQATNKGNVGLTGLPLVGALVVTWA